jgi:predicted dehydrogenase
MIESGQFKPTMSFLKYGHWQSKDLRGMLLTMSSHPIDLAISLFGDVSSVTSRVAYNVPGISLAVTLQFRSGNIAQLMLDSSQPRIQERVEISGTIDGGNALIVVDNVTHMQLHRQGQNGIDLLAPSLDAISPQFDLQDIQVWRPDYGIPNMGQTRHFFQGFAGEVREFVNAILESREPYPGPGDAIKTMTVIEAIAAEPNGTAQLANEPGT